MALEEAEQLRVEISAKFRRERLARELETAGLRTEAWWTDATGGFAVLFVTRSASSR